MKQMIYCDCFLCEYCENGICTVPILHLGQYRKCGEYRISQEKNRRLYERTDRPLGKKRNVSAAGALIFPQEWGKIRIFCESLYVSIDRKAGNIVKYFLLGKEL